MTINTGISIEFGEVNAFALAGICAVHNSMLLLKVGFDGTIRVK